MPYKDKKKKNAYQIAWKRKRRQDWIDSQGGVCVRCGVDEDLEIDHIDARTKTWEIGDIWSRNIYVRHKELQKCQVLCHYCHAEKTYEEEQRLQAFRNVRNKDRQLRLKV